jgi:hypothetical protein
MSRVCVLHRTETADDGRLCYVHVSAVHMASAFWISSDISSEKFSSNL